MSPRALIACILAAALMWVGIFALVDASGVELVRWLTYVVEVVGTVTFLGAIAHLVYLGHVHSQDVD